MGVMKRLALLAFVALHRREPDRATAIWRRSDGDPKLSASLDRGIRQCAEGQVAPFDDPLDSDDAIEPLDRRLVELLAEPIPWSDEEQAALTERVLRAQRVRKSRAS